MAFSIKNRFSKLDIFLIIGFVIYFIFICTYSMNGHIYEQIHQSDSYCKDDFEYCEREFVAFMKYHTRKGLDIDSWYQKRDSKLNTHTMTPLINANMIMPRGYNYTCRLLLNDLSLNLLQDPGYHFYDHCKNGNWEEPFQKYIEFLNRYDRKIKMGDNCDYACRRCVSMSSLLHKTRIASVSLDDKNNIKSCSTANMKISDHRHVHNQDNNELCFKFSLIMVGVILFWGIRVVIYVSIQNIKNRKETKKMF